MAEHIQRAILSNMWFDISTPTTVKLVALRLVLIRVRIWWMRLDPWLVGTTIVVIVLLRIAYRAVGIVTNPANVLAGTVVSLLVLAAALGSLTKRSDRREARVIERVLRMKGFRLTGACRLERV